MQKLCPPKPLFDLDTFCTEMRLKNMWRFGSESIFRTVIDLKSSVMIIDGRGVLVLEGHTAHINKGL